MTIELPITDYDYEYPESAIATRAAEPRDSARLMVLDRATGQFEHAVFHDLPRYLKPGDCLVVNATKVLPCRLLGKKSSGGKVDLLLVRELGPTTWTALSSSIKPGQRIEFLEGLSAKVSHQNGDGEYQIEFASSDLRAYLARNGLAPLPPYIAKKRTPAKEDSERYQTVYARDLGSIAAPTAGLHFTVELLDRLRAAGVAVAEITLHVGRGTFKPIVGEDAATHRMLPERFCLDAHNAALISKTRNNGGRIIAVGTTCTRTLETLIRNSSGFSAIEGESSLYIRPGHAFSAVDSLITNFHLPRSTPLLLASAFAGRERLLAAYREAIKCGYRLYSFGDAMLIL